MTKKNLSDLLKEEAQPAVPPAAAAPAADASKSAAKAAPARTPRSTVTKADLEKQVAELEIALAAVTQQEGTLANQVKGLQGDLETQQARLFELKDALEKAEAETAAKDQQLEKVTAELAEAKQTILKMTELAAAPPPPPEPAKPEPEPKSALAVKLPRRPEMRRGELKGIPEYAIQRGEKSSMLSDADIGWVD